MAQTRDFFCSGLRTAGIAALCVLMVEQPLLAAGPAEKKLKAVSSAGQIQGEERVLHALNRLTFGPRPGDIAAVQAIGLKRWFEQQLQPESIDDSALEARLANFPAMKMSQEALMERYPSPQVLRQMERQNAPLPTDRLEGVKIINLPPDQRMQRLLSMQPKELIAFRRSLSRRELVDAAAGLSPEQREILAALPGSARMVGGELLQSRLVRDIYSDRQLEAVMTDFWLNHFNIYVKKNQNEPFLLPAFERDVIRPRALGKFENLLVATAQSPAMLVYLDNWQSIGPGSMAAQRAAQRQERNSDAKGKLLGLNENYARELMELHTLGVGGGYTQADVTQVAKVFTGWTIDRPYRGAAYGFEPNRHEPGTKQVLGVR